MAEALDWLMRVLGSTAGLAFVGVVLATSAAYAAEPEPITRYDGDWTTTDALGIALVHIHNHCVVGAAFTACEELVDGHSFMLRVFQPTNSRNLGREYLVTDIYAGGGPVKTSRLHIEGDRWEYDGVNEREINQFHGPNRFHVDTQWSEDGQTWRRSPEGSVDVVRAMP